MFDDLTIYDLINEFRTWLLEKYTLVKKDGTSFDVAEIKEIEEFKQIIEDLEAMHYLVLDPEGMYLSTQERPIPGISVINLMTLDFVTESVGTVKHV